MIYFAGFFDLLIMFFFLKDVNECEGANNCEQVCHNNVGSYYCSCKKGYVLAADSRKCVGKAPDLCGMLIVNPFN